MTPTVQALCTCPGPCDRCPPLTTDADADAEYRTTRHLFAHTTAPGRPRGRQ